MLQYRNALGIARTYVTSVPELLIFGRGSDKRDAHTPPRAPDCAYDMIRDLKRYPFSWTQRLAPIASGMGTHAKSGIALIAFAVIVVAFQYLTGAYSSEFGAEPDESAHYVTGLMIRDYLADFAPDSPMRYAEQYYLHYPRVAFGLWPPLFHLTEGLWFLLFSPSRVPALLFIGCWTTALAMLLFQETRRMFGFTAGIAAGVLLVSLPAVQRAGGMIMADMMVAVLGFAAVNQFGRYLDTGSWRNSAGFGVLAALCILTKYNALALALVPPLSLIALRRWNWLRRPSLWLSAAIVIGLCAPWYIAAWSWVRYAMESGDFPLSSAEAFWGNAATLLNLPSVPVCLFAIIGLAQCLRLAASARCGGKWMAWASSIAAFWLFHSFPAPWVESRYLLAVLPPLILFAAIGIHSLARRWASTSWSERQRAWVLTCVLALFYLSTSFFIHRKEMLGFQQAADMLLAQADIAHSAILVSSESFGEGVLVSEIAMRGRHLAPYVLRATKLLAQVRLMGNDYRPRYASVEDLAEALDRIPVRMLVIDNMPGPVSWKHHRQLQEMLQVHADRWESLGVYGPQAQIRVYRNRTASIAGPKFQIDMDFTLKRSIGD